MIGVYHSELDTTASWQALMFRSEGFRQAATAYKRLYHQLKQCRLKMVDGSVYYLDGNYEEATEDNDFITSALKIETADERFREFHIELELLFKMDEWVVNVNMVSKKKDSDMRPDWMMTGK
jgi:virulence-associated protein VapD